MISTLSRWGRALALLVAATVPPGCLGPAFRVPALTAFPPLARAPSVPAGESVSGPVPNGVTEMQSTRANLLRRDAVLAVGPIGRDGHDLSLALLQRLLARRDVRVIDLSRSGALDAQAASTRADPTTTLHGPWSALTWAARWGDASMLLVSEPVTVTRVADPRQARLRYDAAALAAYASERDARVAECRDRLPRLEAEQRRVAAEYQQARSEYEATRTWVDRIGRDAGGERARQEVEAALAALEAQRAGCASAERDLPSADVLTGRAAAQNDARTMSQASGSFRVIALPGGELLWTASLARRGDDDELAVGALLDAVVDTLHGDRRTPTVGDAAAPEVPAVEARPRRGRHRRRR